PDDFDSSDDDLDLQKSREKSGLSSLAIDAKAREEGQASFHLTSHVEGVRETNHLQRQQDTHDLPNPTNGQAANEEEEKVDPLRTRQNAYPRAGKYDRVPAGVEIPGFKDKNTDVDVDFIKVVCTMEDKFYAVVDDQGNIETLTGLARGEHFFDILCNSGYRELLGLGSTVSQPGPRFGYTQMRPRMSCSTNSDKMGKYVPEGFRYKEHLLCVGDFEITLSMENTDSEFTEDQYDSGDFVAVRIAHYLREIGYPSVVCHPRFSTTRIILKPWCTQRKSILLKDLMVAIGAASPKFISFIWHGMRWPLLQTGKEGVTPRQAEYYDRTSPMIAFWRWITGVREDEVFKESGCKLQITVMDVACKFLKLEYPSSFHYFGESTREIKKIIFPDNPSQMSMNISTYPMWDARRPHGGVAGQMCYHDRVGSPLPISNFKFYHCIAHLVRTVNFMV
ncbi:unnamed protein product, partial [marine sediment metagenome]